MDKKKKIIVISTIAIIVLLLIAGGIWYFVANKNNNNENNQETSKIGRLYNTLKEKEIYSFSFILDENNRMYYAKNQNKAYTSTIYNGSTSNYIIRDGNSYLIMEDTKKYYTYANNTIDLNLIAETLETATELQYQTGTEEIEGKNYEYEEYPLLTNIAMGDFPEETNNTKTRFYFQGDKLVYIKTIAEGKQELLKVEVSYKVDNKLFEIPSDYTQG